MNRRVIAGASQQQQQKRLNPLSKLESGSEVRRLILQREPSTERERERERERKRECECVLCTAIALSRTAGAILSPGFRLSLTSANYLSLLHFAPHLEDEKERFPLVFFILALAKKISS
jgi:hypothetical protein